MSSYIVLGMTTNLPLSNDAVEQLDLPEHIKEILSNENLSLRAREAVLEISLSDDPTFNVEPE
jgi:hypothetical protein